jgi:hypothetical protein
MPQNYVLPANSIKIDGQPLIYELEAAPGSAILPGDVVEFNTSYCTDGMAKIKECGVNSEVFLGVAEQGMINQGLSTAKFGDVDEVFAAGDIVRVMAGVFVFKGRLAAGETITCGDLLKPAASGELAKLTCESGTSDPDENACLKAAQALTSYSSATVFQFGIFRWLR